MYDRWQPLNQYELVLRNAKSSEQPMFDGELIGVNAWDSLKLWKIKKRFWKQF